MCSLCKCLLVGCLGCLWLVWWFRWLVCLGDLCLHWFGFVVSVICVV